MKRIVMILLLISLVLCGCIPGDLTGPSGVHTESTGFWSEPGISHPSQEGTISTEAGSTVMPSEETAATEMVTEPTQVPTEPETEPTEVPTEPTEPVTEPTEVPTVSTEPENEPTVPETEPLPRPQGSYVIVIDPGHQRHSNSDLEPNGPGSETMKKKVSSGTKSDYLGWYEYELNLVVALLLRSELESRGYTVIMTRTTHDVDISNVQRAQMANEAKADAFIRIHANDSDDPDVHGAFTICLKENNAYQPHMYEINRCLSEHVIAGYVAATGCKNRGVWETNTMTGINWCEVPNCIIEMGYMSNKAEDAKMATEEYQLRMAKGIADGLDSYFVAMEE